MQPGLAGGAALAVVRPPHVGRALLPLRILPMHVCICRQGECEVFRRTVPGCHAAAAKRAATASERFRSCAWPAAGSGGRHWVSAGAHLPSTPTLPHETLHSQLPQPSKRGTGWLQSHKCTPPTVHPLRHARRFIRIHSRVHVPPAPLAPLLQRCEAEPARRGGGWVRVMGLGRSKHALPCARW